MNRLDYAFIIFFLTLGPIKCMGPFLQLTANFDKATKHRLALRGTLIATIVGLFIVFVVDRLRSNWEVGQADLMVTFGILLLMSALGQLRIAEHQREVKPPPPPTDPKGLALNPIAFPTIITPYGIVALLLFASVASDVNFLIGVFVLFLGIMVLNYLSMIYAAQIINFVKAPILQAFGWVLAVLQASLAIYALLTGLKLSFFGTTGVV